MEPQTVEDWINEAVYSVDEQEYERAIAEALIAVALALWELTCEGDDDDDCRVPAGPIAYEDYGDSGADN